MFLRKLFSGENKLTWVLVDLLIVVIGVYCAFLIQNYAAVEKTKQEKEKIFSALKHELEVFRITMPERAGNMASQVRTWSQVRDEGKYRNFSDWIFIEPQYAYQIIEYSIKIQDNDIIDFELYQSLQRLYGEIKKLEHAERLIMQTSLKYQPVPEQLNSTSLNTRSIDNVENFRMFIRFAESRAQIMQRVAIVSQETLAIINPKMDPGRRKEIERRLIASNTDRVRSVEEAIAVVKQLFPDFSEQEVREIYEENKNK